MMHSNILETRLAVYELDFCERPVPQCVKVSLLVLVSEGLSS